MVVKEKIKNSAKTEVDNEEVIKNILRVLSMLEKALDRLKRKNWHPDQYPNVVQELEAVLRFIRIWIQGRKSFSNTQVFIIVLGAGIDKVGCRIEELIMECEPVNGKKREKNYHSIQEKERRNISESISAMNKHMADLLDSLKTPDTDVGIEMERALLLSYEQHLAKIPVPQKKEPISKRGRKTIVFPCSDLDYYLELVNDRKRFWEIVVNNLSSLNHHCGHHPGCKGEQGFIMKGFRGSPRKSNMKGGEKKDAPLRMVECRGCGEKFSLLPSFLPREKHYEIEIIGSILRSICLFGQSIRSALESTDLTGKKVKSVQTILNWIKWIGFLHPAEILMRANVKCSGYFQEDEGFEKEPDLRTYSVVMIDSGNCLVWHMDYVDHVDEETLCESFEKFVERIDFKVLGVTKDKWRASTNALKSVFQKIWIGFCHRHFLKKLLDALRTWEKETGCGPGEVQRIYKKVKKILSTSSSGITLTKRIEMAGESAFEHPLLRPVFEELKKNAVHYTAYKRRSGIKKTTSLADNFLKIIKRKLRQVESFRDRPSTANLFRAIANVRNFVPYMPGAKNSHKSPFMLAGGVTFDLPWIQTMNCHNAFLFNEQC